MATTYTERDVARVETTGSIVEAAGGIAVVVLSIIALSRATSATLPSIAVIILGAALLAEGGAIATEFSRMLSMTAGGTLNATEIGGGMTTEIFIGAGVLVLGVLALVGIATATLIAVAVIATGGMMLLTAAGAQRMNEVRVELARFPDSARRLMLSAGSGAAAFQILAAIAAIVLGILALSSAAHMAVFMLVGLLLLGIAVAMSGPAITGSLMRFVTR